MVPRELRDDYVHGKITKNEFDVLLWIFLNTNPYNGFFLATYQGLVQDFKNNFSLDTIRKIIPSLRKKGYIYFLSHSGREGCFPIYPVGFRLTNGEIQTLDYLKSKLSAATLTHSREQLDTEPENN